MNTLGRHRSHGRHIARVLEPRFRGRARAVAFTWMTSCLGAVWLWSASALACRCAQPPAPAIALEGAEAVFIGRVVDVRRHSDRERAIDFVVERVFKGSLGRTVTVLTPMSSAACGRKFENHVSYLVYTGRLGDALHDNLCSRTTPLEDAGDDIAELTALPLGARDPSDTHERPSPEGASSIPEAQPDVEGQNPEARKEETPPPVEHEAIPTLHEVAPALDETPAQLVTEAPRLDDGEREPDPEPAAPARRTTSAAPAAPVESVVSPEAIQSGSCANVSAWSAPHLLGLLLTLVARRRRNRAWRTQR
ncbi:MAG: hypothetical protein ACO3JL_03935 [Myxococcota bacterium]